MTPAKRSSIKLKDSCTYLKSVSLKREPFLNTALLGGKSLKGMGKQNNFFSIEIQRCQMYMECSDCQSYPILGNSPKT